LSPTLDFCPVSFRDAVAQFRAFLKERGRPDAVVWIKADDLIAVRSRLYVRLRDPNRRWMDAQCRYDVGVDRKIGIVLQQVCQVPGLSCCYVSVLKNSIAGLKFSVADEVKRATPVVNRLYWLWLRARGRKNAFSPAA